MTTVSDSDHAARQHIVDCRRCAKVNVGDAWLTEADAIRVLRTFDEPELPRFASAVCPPCLAYLGIRPDTGRLAVSATGGSV